MRFSAKKQKKTLDTQKKRVYMDNYGAGAICRLHPLYHKKKESDMTKETAIEIIIFLICPPLGILIWILGGIKKD